MQPPPLPGRGELPDLSPAVSTAWPPDSCGKMSFTLLTRDGHADVSAEAANGFSRNPAVRLPAVDRLIDEARRTPDAAG
ncbi:hypothetical protein, partial [Nonomuraea dietziae]|uniref:hypothetical protein n=1 Tax=Nonomuraea dietziae TaxID=65515 RepID=UPI0034182D6C